MGGDKNELRNNEIEKMRIKYGFYKFLLGTVAISALSIIINGMIQSEKLNHEIQIKESEYIAQFLEHALKKQLEDRRDFAAYFEKLSPSEEARSRWQSYLQFVENLILKAKEAEVKKKETELKLNVAAETIAGLQLEAEKARSEIAKLTAIGETDNVENVEELRRLNIQLNKTTEEAGKYSQNLEELQNQLTEQKTELASLRSKTVDSDIHGEVFQIQQKVASNFLGWSFLGHYDIKKKSWKTHYFDFAKFSGEPQPYDLLGKKLSVWEKTGAINIRNSPPNSIGRLGTIVRALEPGEVVKVLEIKEWFNSGYMWAKVERPDGA